MFGVGVSWHTPETKWMASPFVVKWLVRWVTSGSKEQGGGGGPQEKDRYEGLTDQKIDDADYEDL